MSDSDILLAPSLLNPIYLTEFTPNKGILFHYIPACFWTGNHRTWRKQGPNKNPPKSKTIQPVFCPFTDHFPTVWPTTCLRGKIQILLHFYIWWCVPSVVCLTHFINSKTVIKNLHHGHNISLTYDHKCFFFFSCFASISFLKSLTGTDSGVVVSKAHWRVVNPDFPLLSLHHCRCWWSPQALMSCVGH